MPVGLLVRCSGIHTACNVRVNCITTTLDTTQRIFLNGRFVLICRCSQPGGKIALTLTLIFLLTHLILVPCRSSSRCVIRNSSEFFLALGFSGRYHYHTGIRIGKGRTGCTSLRFEVSTFTIRDSTTSGSIVIEDKFVIDCASNNLTGIGIHVGTMTIGLQTHTLCTLRRCLNASPGRIDTSLRFLDESGETKFLRGMINPTGPTRFRHQRYAAAILAFLETSSSSFAWARSSREASLSL